VVDSLAWFSPFWIQCIPTLIDDTVCGCYSTAFLKRALKLYVIGACFKWVSKNIHYIDACSKEIGLHMLMITQSIVNTIWRTNVFSSKINKHTFSTIVIKSREFHFQYGCCWCFILDLQMQHTIEDAHLIKRRRRWEQQIQTEQEALACSLDFVTSLAVPRICYVLQKCDYFKGRWHVHKSGLKVLTYHKSHLSLRANEIKFMLGKNMDVVYLCVGVGVGVGVYVWNSSLFIRSHVKWAPEAMLECFSETSSMWCWIHIVPFLSNQSTNHESYQTSIY
jgi:hypothetical protein